MYTPDMILGDEFTYSGMLGDYCDEELFVMSELFQDDPCALQIQLYYDELELCNPLGSKKHKLGKVRHLHVRICIMILC